MTLLSERIAVVTGASSGIGRAVALALGAAGARVVVNYRSSEAAASDVVDAIHSGGGDAVAIQADVSDAAQIDAMIAATRARFGTPAIWANMAGADILTGAGAELADSDKLDLLLNVDVRGTVLCSWAVAPLMREAGGGTIINMSWDLALRGMAGTNPQMFATAKAAVTGFTRSLALSLAPEIRVNEVAPGWIETAFADSVMSDEYRQGVIAATPLARMGVPADVAGAVVYLASDAAAFVTGQTLKVNGGLSS